MRRLLMPSLIETVGLPYLEAMHFGRPIPTSDLDFAHDVCGDAASYFDPWDPDAIAASVSRFAADPGLRARLAAASSARARSERSSWDEITRRIVDAISAITA